MKAIRKDDIAARELSSRASLPRTKRGRRRLTSVERTLASIVRRTERAFYAEELARAGGLLQRLDPRVKVCGLLLLLRDETLLRLTSLIHAHRHVHGTGTVHAHPHTHRTHEH